MPIMGPLLAATMATRSQAGFKPVSVQWIWTFPLTIGVAFGRTSAGLMASTIK